ncbi:hypothetical protein [Lysinibacillus sp. NPDC093688]
MTTQPIVQPQNLSKTIGGQQLIQQLNIDLLKVMRGTVNIKGGC